MANSNYVPVIDSNGNYSRRRRTWVEKHERSGSGYWRNGAFCFLPRRRDDDPIEMLAHGRARFADVLTIEPNEPTPGTGGSPFLSYPWSERGHRSRGLRGQHPAIAREGAGLR